MPTFATFAVNAAPALATGILLLATARAWRAERFLVELVAGACLLAAAAAGLSLLHPVVFRALLPLAAVAAAWLACAHAEWRFAPDRGQRGFTWAVPAAAGRAAPLALGAGFLVAPWSWGAGICS